MRMRLESKDKLLRKFVKKYPSFSVSSNHIKGQVEVKSVRFYGKAGDIVNVDIIFNGEIYVHYNNEPQQWIKKDIYKNFIKKRLNRFIRHAVYYRLKTYLYYFNIKINSRSDIKKIIL